MHRIFRNIFFGMVSISFFIMLYFTSVQILLNSKTFFIKYYDFVNIEDKLGINSEQCYGVIKKLVDFKEGRTNKLELEEDLHQIDSFNEDEVQHMEYVKEIYQKLIVLRNISFILYLIMLANFICFKFDGIRFNIIGFMFTMIILTISGVFTAINFSKFWNIFHDIIFGDKNMLFFSVSSIKINLCTYGIDKAFIFTPILLYIIFFTLFYISFLFYYKFSCIIYSNF